MTSDRQAARRRRIKFRACHRGTKEMDWLLGRYAEARLDTMKPADLDRFEALVGLPDPDVQNWIMTPGAPIDPDHAPLIAELRRFHGLS